MHELAVAQAIIEKVEQWRQSEGGLRISAVGVRIGLLTDLVPDSLEFGFEALTSGTRFENTRLEIERVPITGRCAGCGQSFTVESFLFVCPECGGRDVALLSGNELDISYLCVEDHNDEHEPEVKLDSAKGHTT